MKKLFFYSIVILLLTSVRQSFAQDHYLNTVFKLNSSQYKHNPFLSYEDNYLDKQAEVILNLTNEVLTNFPPQIPESLEHKMALYLLDAIFHDVKAPERLPVQEFMQKRIENLVDEIENTTVEEGAIIWKLYNHSFIVRTKNVTIGFDLIRPSGHFKNFVTDTKAELGNIIRQCDVLFVSHAHSDHADAWVAQTFIEQGKPVVSPPDVWRETTFYKKVIHLDRDINKFHSLAIQQGKQELKVVIYPGHQYVGHDILNNISVIYTPDGFCFSHTGDQDSWNDSIMISDIRNHHQIDVLMYNTLMDVDWISGFDPELVMTGHENEMSHPVHRRWSYWDKYARLNSISYPFVVLAWGEKYHYFKKSQK